MLISYDVSSMTARPSGIGHFTRSLLENMRGMSDHRIEPYALTSARPIGVSSPVRRIGIPARLIVTAWTRMGRPYADGFLGGPDLVHGTNFWVPPVRRAKAVATIHDLTFLLYPQMCSPQVRRYRWIIPKMLGWTSLVITPTNLIADQVSSELGFPRDRIAVTYEGVREVFNHAGPAEPEGPPYVLFAGTAEPRKNLARLAEAMLQVDPSVMLVVAGSPGPSSAALSRLGPRLRVLGYVDDAELASWVAGARAFVFPSLYEGFGLPPLEAMAAGTPVVASRAGSLPEVLGDAPFWCDPLDPGSIAEAVSSAVSDEAQRASSIEKGKGIAARYTWESTARATLDAYATTLAS